MRIFTAVRHSIDPQFYYGALWSANFYPALRGLGCEIVESQTDLLPSSRFMGIAGNFTKEEHKTRVAITEKILDELARAHEAGPIDLFLSYFYNAHFDPAGFAKIHKMGIPTVNFYCNSIYQLEYVEGIAKAVKFSWHTEKDARESYLKIGANPVWVQMAADPEIYHPIPGVMREKRACFAGQRYADRAEWLAGLISKNVPVDIYGKDWDVKLGNPGTYACAAAEIIKKEGLISGVKRIGRQLRHKKVNEKASGVISLNTRGFAKDLSETFARHEVVFNLSNVWQDGRPGSGLVPHVRLRDFEAPMSGACYITGYTDEIAEFYELGKEIDTYRSQEELADKIKFYLVHPEEAENLREAGFRRALRDHTWKRRFETLFEKIGIKV